jgi:hypothetical protein
MNRIVSGITCLAQHILTLALDPQRYRPAACPRCGVAKPWCHGSYHRKADRRPQPGACCNPVPVARFRCPRGRGCGHTCSRLPECMSPRRWYDWALQQAVVMAALNGVSLNACSRQAGVDRRTARRWWHWLQARSGQFEFFLRSRFPEWGREAGFLAFWQGALGHMPLGALMAWLDREVLVP